MSLENLNMVYTNSKASDQSGQPSTQSDQHLFFAGPRSAVGNVSGYRWVSDCRSRGREFDPGPVPYFRGD